LAYTQVGDAGLAYFKDCKNLKHLALGGTQMSGAGLAHLKDCNSLKTISLNGSKVSDVGLAHLKDFKNLIALDLRKTKITAAGIADLKKALPNCKIESDFNLKGAADPDRKAAEWVLSIGGIVKVNGEDREIKAELMKRNPGFDGKVHHGLDGGVVIHLDFVTDNVADISPVRALTGLLILGCNGSNPGKGKRSDLTPLTGTKLVNVNCGSSLVSDLTPLKDLKLTLLIVNDTQVSDLSPLTGMKLTALSVTGTKVSDLSPLKDMKLTNLVMHNAKVTDLSVLKGMPLTQVSYDVNAVVNVEILRSITTLETINGQPREAFWKEVDAKKAGK
jgi:Leucine-rich repeat (LRR) protein